MSDNKKMLRHLLLVAAVSLVLVVIATVVRKSLRARKVRALRIQAMQACYEDQDLDWAIHVYLELLNLCPEDLGGRTGLAACYMNKMGDDARVENREAFSSAVLQWGPKWLDRYEEILKIAVQDENLDAAETDVLEVSYANMQVFLEELDSKFSKYDDLSNHEPTRSFRLEVLRTCQSFEQAYPDVRVESEKMRDAIEPAGGGFARAIQSTVAGTGKEKSASSAPGTDREIASGLEWGKPVNGLACSLQATKKTIRVKEPVKMTLMIRNVGRNAIILPEEQHRAKIQGYVWLCDNDAPMIEYTFPFRVRGKFFSSLKPGDTMTLSVPGPRSLRYYQKPLEQWSVWCKVEIKKSSGYSGWTGCVLSNKVLIDVGEAPSSE